MRRHRILQRRIDAMHRVGHNVREFLDVGGLHEQTPRQPFPTDSAVEPVMETAIAPSGRVVPIRKKKKKKKKKA